MHGGLMLLVSGTWEYCLESNGTNLLQQGVEEDNQATWPYSNNPVTASFDIWAHCTYGWWCRCQDDPNSSPIRELEETTRASPYHAAKHRPARSERLQPHTEWSSRSGSELSSVEADVYVWHYTLLVVPARKEEEEGASLPRLSWKRVH